MIKTIAMLFTLTLPLLAIAETTPDYIQKNAITFSPGSLPPSLVNIFENKKLVLLGEIHGTAEMPRITAEILSTLSEKNSINFGIEFPSDMQPEIDRFMANGDPTELKATRFFQDVKYGSGRNSHAMIELLQKIRGLKPISVFCFDIPFNEPANDRDTKMAQNILAFMKRHPDTRVVTFSGNYHSRLKSGLPSDPNYKLMGAEILRLSNGALSLENTSNLIFRYDEGSAWNCLLRDDNSVDCSVHEFGPLRSVYGTSVNSDLYFLKEPEITDGHFNTIFVRKVSASMPF